MQIKSIQSIISVGKFSLTQPSAAKGVGQRREAPVLDLRDTEWYNHFRKYLDNFHRS